MQSPGHAEEVMCPRFQRAGGQEDVPSTPGPSTLRGLGEETWVGIHANPPELEKPLRRNSETDPSSLGHLPTYTWAAQLEEPSLSCPQPGWQADMAAEEVEPESGCRQTGLDLAISSMVGIGLGQLRTWVETTQL